MAQEEPSDQDVERAVFEQIRLILEDQGKTACRLSRDDVLDTDLGLSSAELILLVSNLAAKLGTDPFEQSASITDVRTAGDLCRLYRDLRSCTVGESGGDSLPGRRRPVPGTRTGSS
jgi:acyl carrier protein